MYSIVIYIYIFAELQRLAEAERPVQVYLLAIACCFMYDVTVIIGYVYNYCTLIIVCLYLVYLLFVMSMFIVCVLVVCLCVLFAWLKSSLWFAQSRLTLCVYTYFMSCLCHCRLIIVFSYVLMCCAYLIKQSLICFTQPRLTSRRDFLGPPI